MSTVETTFRVSAILRKALSQLSELRNASQSDLVNEALHEYMEKRIPGFGTDLESALDDLEKYKERDPHFDHAIESFVDAEMSIEDDPAEGVVVEQPGPVESAILKHLDG